MVEDNTPTVTSRRRKPTGHQRLRLETAQRLQAISKKHKERRKAKKARKDDDEIKVYPEGAEQIGTNSTKPKGPTSTSTEEQKVKTKKPKIKKSRLREPPIPPAKFRKRQIHKTWLPTHLWHSKRARMTPPMEPMWRFAMPLTPNIKNYRNAHRASADKGVVAWDMSYMSTISISGVEDSIVGLLKALGIDNWGQSGAKWRAGTRVWEGWVYERDAPRTWIAPVAVIWKAAPKTTAAPVPDGPPKAQKQKREVIVRVHPSAFFQLWEQVIRLAKVQKPALTVEDLRFEIGSIEVTGPDASEVLVGILRPLGLLDNTGGSLTSEEMTWTKLGRTPPAALPANAVIGMSITDPRLRFPPRTLPADELKTNDPMLVQMLGNWPLDRSPHQAALFDHKARVRARRSLPTQKAINRRKGQADPGEFPAILPSDPPIPVIAFATRIGADGTGTWTVLLPWACVLPVWKSLVYYPLSTGGVVRFGGVNEKRQLAYENDTPWFPADFPATKAGQQWEFDESNRREAEWKRRPKARRVEFASIDLGNGRRGEIGDGWMCDWQRLVRGAPLLTDEDTTMNDAGADAELKVNGLSAHTGTTGESTATVVPPHQILHHLPASIAKRTQLPNAKIEPPPNALATVKITMLSRGRPSDCARIYRLPTTDPDLRHKWLTQQPSPQSAKSNSKKAKFPPKPDENASAAMKRAWLAAAILTEPPEPGSKDYPVVPDECDLVGFVTTGNFSLMEGKGVGIGSALIERVVPGEHDWENDRMGKKVLKREFKLCIVRDAGQVHGRLAKWELI